MNPFRSGYAFVLAALSRPDIAIALLYAAGLLAGILTEAGSTGKPLLSIAAPVVAAVLVRLSRRLTFADACRLAAVHAVFGMAAGETVWACAVDIAHNLVAIAVAVTAFGWLRAHGFIASQVRVAATVTIVALAAATAAAPFGALQGAEQAEWAWLATYWASIATAFALVLWLVLTHDRDEAPLPIGDAADEPPPSMLEHAAASALVAALVLGAVWHGRAEAAFAASTALLWFALRLGLFPTSIAAFSSALLLLGFAADGRWPAIFGGGDSVEADLVRYLSLALFAAPSILVAAAVHDHKRAKQAFAYRARHDGLTELSNRSRFLEVLEGLSQSSRSGGRRFALLLIDLDFFKTVNDSFGHARGDALLVEVARRLRCSIRASDLAARIGGDEFAVLAPVRTVEDAQSLARRLVETVNQVFDLGGVRYAPSITVGGVLAPDSSSDGSRLMLIADEALYLAKAAGRNCWRFKTAGASAEDGAPGWSMGEGAARTETVFID